MTTLRFKLSEPIDQDKTREVVFQTTMHGDHIDCYVEAFASFLAAAGFNEANIKAALGRMP